jgi:hypothetical protein
MSKRKAPVVVNVTINNYFSKAPRTAAPAAHPPERWLPAAPPDKGRAISDIVNDRSRTLATAKPEIDAEWAKCRLLCRNCHHTRSQWD